MKCPACGANTSFVYKCDKCGEVRCAASSQCPGTYKTRKGSSSSSSYCLSCKKGKMVIVK